MCLAGVFGERSVVLTGELKLLFPFLNCRVCVLRLIFVFMVVEALLYEMIQVLATGRIALE